MRQIEEDAIFEYFEDSHIIYNIDSLLIYFKRSFSANVESSTYAEDYLGKKKIQLNKYYLRNVNKPL